MRGTFFIHIGLPKTATTTLQRDVFPAISGNNTTYIGVSQPRDVCKQQDQYRRVYNAAETGADIENLRDDLTSALERGTSLVLSEEMLTVSTAKTTWREKLKNLGGLVNGLDYELILTVREPSAALFSYYVELYARFSKRFPDFVQCALHDDDMHIYHYRELMNEVSMNFVPERVHVFRFEDIVNNNIVGLVDLISPESNDAKRIELANHNTRRRAKGHVHTRYRTTARDVVRGIVKMLKMDDVKLVKKLKNIGHPVTRHLDKVAIKDRTVALPSSEEMNYLKSSLRDETAALDEYFGIRYD